MESLSRVFALSAQPSSLFVRLSDGNGDNSAGSAQSGFSWTGVLALTTVALGGYGWYRRLQEIRMFKDAPPGEMGWWVIGELLEWIRTGSCEYQLKQIAKFKRTNFSSHLYFSPVVLVGNPADVNLVLTAETRGTSRIRWPRHFRELMGARSITVVTGDAHVKLRRFLNPVFAPSAVTQYSQAIRSEIVTLFDHQSKRDLVATDELKDLTLSIFVRVVFGNHIDDNRFHMYSSLLREWISGLASWVPIRLPFPFSNRFTRAMNARDKLLELIHEDLLDGGGEEERETLLSRFREAFEAGQMTKEEIGDTVLILFIAGHDTTYAVMSTALTLLYDPAQASYLNRMREELASNTNGKTPDEIAKNSPLLVAFLKEVLRLYPPFSAGLRQCTHPEGLTLSDGSIVPYGATMAYYSSAIHRGISGESPVKNDEGLDLHSFHPERYLQEDDKSSHAELHYRRSLLAFGGGNRSCIGEHLAMLELRTFVYELVTHYDVKVSAVEQAKYPLMYFRSTYTLATREQSHALEEAPMGASSPLAARPKNERKSSHGSLTYSA